MVEYKAIDCPNCGKPNEYSLGSCRGCGLPREVFDKIEQEEQVFMKLGEKLAATSTAKSAVRPNLLA